MSFPPIQRNDHVAQAADTALAFGYQPRGERAIAILGTSNGTGPASV